MPAVEGVLQAEHVEQRVDGKELPEEYPVGNLAEESHGAIAEHRGQPGPSVRLEGDWCDHGGRDKRVERQLGLGLPQGRRGEALRACQRRAGQGEGQGGDQPAGRRRRGHGAAEGSYRSGGTVIGIGPCRDDRQGHPWCEPAERPWQGRAEPEVRRRVIDQRDECEGDHGQDRDGDQESAGPGRDARRSPAGGQGEQAAENGKDGVEGNLYGQAPHLSKPRRAGARPPRMRVVDLAEEQVQRPGCHGPHVRPAQGDDGDDYHRPVRGDDPQDPADQVGPDVGSVAPAERVQRPGPEEQQAGQREEDRHADVAANGGPGSRRSGEG